MMCAKLKLRLLFAALLIIVTVSIVNATVSSARPGFKVRLSQLGLDYAAHVAVDVLAGKVVGQRIPDQHGSSHVAVGKVTYDLTQMTLTSFGRPSSRVAVQPSRGLTWSISGASLSMRGHWHYEYRLGFIKIRDSGSFDVSVSSVSISVSVTLGRDSRDRPTIRSTGCSSGIGHVSVRFHGGASWLYNLFSGAVENAVKKQINDVLCREARKAIDVDAAKQMVKLKIVVPLGKTFDLDYGLVDAPKFSAGYVESYHKGEIYWHAKHTEAPFTPDPLPSEPGVKPMVTLWMSQYTMDTFGLASQEGGILHKVVSAKDLPPKQRGVLNTTCTSFVCVGSMIPAVAKRFPHCTVAMDMKTSKSPTLLAGPTGLTGVFVGNIKFSANKQNNANYLFTLATRVNMTLTSEVVDSRITGNVTEFKFDIKQLDSAVGKLPIAELRFLMKVAIRGFVIPQLNALGAKGLQIPSIDHVHFVKPQIKLENGAIRVATDLLYKSDTLYFKSEL